MKKHCDESLQLTTISISPERKIRLKWAAKSLCNGANLGQIRAFIVSVLLKKVRKELGAEALVEHKVRYQPARQEDNYLIYSLPFFSKDHEYAAGMRYLFKFSVSFILALAIDLFLDEIVKNGLRGEEEINNYFVKSVFKRKIEIQHSQNDKYEYWRVIWEKQKE